MFEQIALQDDALTLATGEPFVSEMFGTGLHGIARLAAEPAHGERHRFALDQTIVEPGGARRRDLGAEIDVRTVGEHERRPRVLRPAEAPNLDDATDRRRMREGFDATKTNMMGAAVRAVDHGIGFAGQLIMEALVDQPADDRRTGSARR